MEKIELGTPDITQENISKLIELFPQVATETEINGEVARSIDFDTLRELLGEVVEGQRERYQFTWPGKRKAKAEARKPSTSTFRPQIAKSVNWDSTNNLYIEGDNLEALKMLRAAYAGEIKLIYIDPPYNTGHDFVYDDDYAQTRSEYDHVSGDYDENGGRLVANTESNGRYHSDWCSMMYPRLQIARDLLSNDGILVMSISDAEFHNLKKMADEIFGSENYCADILWNSTKSVTNTALISVSHTYNLVYFKNMSYFVTHRSEFRLPDDGSGFENPDNDPRGPWKADPFQVGGWRPNQQYEIINPNTGVVYRPNEGCSWKNDFEKFQELVKDNRIVFGKTGDGGPQRKRFIWEAQDRGKVAKTWWDDVETTTNGTQLVKKMFDNIAVFDNPKPVGLLVKILQLCTSRDSLCLDFFSGSATTAHAVMKINAEEQSSRKFILVQYPEEVPEDSQAKKAGYDYITEIGEERIRRAGVMIREEIEAENRQLKIGEEAKIVPDVGFRVMKIDSSNIKNVGLSPEETTQASLLEFVDNVKPDRTYLDLLFEILPQFRIPYSASINEVSLGGKNCFVVNDGQLIACFDTEVGVETIEAIAKMQPLYAVMRDMSMFNDSTYANFEELFKTYSPDTIRRVI